MPCYNSAYTTPVKVYGLLHEHLMQDGKVKEELRLELEKFFVKHFGEGTITVRLWPSYQNGIEIIHSNAKLDRSHWTRYESNTAKVVVALYPEGKIGVERENMDINKVEQVLEEFVKERHQVQLLQNIAFNRVENKLQKLGLSRNEFEEPSTIDPLTEVSRSYDVPEDMIQQIIASQNKGLLKL